MLGIYEWILSIYLFLFLSLSLSFHPPPLSTKNRLDLLSRCLDNMVIQGVRRGWPVKHGSWMGRMGWRMEREVLLVRKLKILGFNAMDAFIKNCTHHILPRLRHYKGIKVKLIIKKNFFEALIMKKTSTPIAECGSVTSRLIGKWPTKRPTDGHQGS